MKKETVLSYLKQYSLSTMFPERVQQAMQLETYTGGSLLFSQGEKSDTLYLLVEGKLKVSRLSPEGKRLILAFKSPFDFVGDIEYIRKSTLINTVEAVSTTTVIRIPYEALENNMTNNTKWLQFLLETITHKFELKSHAMNFSLLYAVDVRVASYLLAMTPDDTALDSTLLVDMADLIGTSYRHLNRVLKKFEEQGWILKKRGKITIINRDSMLKQFGNNIYE
ncbi:transcriptional regulator, Crp/Fnr family [Planococcus sp. PAMC 21323]|uniref:Crp/Fnr family transcriptional regulator n=1 Tax=Planococcus sp. PAMC 21323 TaxID=1526927 RepID=UPI00056DAA5C|nr:Crp/Fnr family transcriptional regulator [Planococcus sp. PAMC 21323]AIY05421.1 transcriptional regulator, Crp/Fnr family [Planococcus sp. PAMC 21323]